MITTLAIVKQHLKVSASIETEDDLILLYMGAAEAGIKNYLDDAGTIPGQGDSPVDIPFPIQAAQLLMIADMYENRSASMTTDIKDNPTLVRLLFPYRKNLGV